MDKAKNIRQTVIRSLSAIGAVKDAQFYAELFSAQSPEKFALIVIDPRCLKNPLLEVLVSNLKIINDLGLAPILLIGALDEDSTSIRFQTHRLCKDLELAGVQNSRLNTKSYGLMDSVIKVARSGQVCVLETHQDGEDLERLTRALMPSKVIFLQPSGAIRQNGERIAVINMDDPEQMELDSLTSGQYRFLEFAQKLSDITGRSSVYVIASPLNLLQELFTVKGSGTLIRRGAKLKSYKTLRAVNKDILISSIEQGFDKQLKSKITDWPIQNLILDEDYRGGAVMISLAEMPYLSKFWVVKEARGEGLARDIWDQLVQRHPRFFWRSRRNNPFNDWYLKTCDGMQISGDWRVFWRGLGPNEIEPAIIAAASTSPDF